MDRETFFEIMEKTSKRRERKKNVFLSVGVAIAIIAAAAIGGGIALRFTVRDAADSLARVHHGAEKDVKIEASPSKEIEITRKSPIDAAIDEIDRRGSQKVVVKRKVSSPKKIGKKRDIVEIEKLLKEGKEREALEKIRKIIAEKPSPELLKIYAEILSKYDPDEAEAVKSYME